MYININVVMKELSKITDREKAVDFWKKNK